MRVSAKLGLSPVSKEMRELHAHPITYGAMVLHVTQDEVAQKELFINLAEQVAIWMHAPDALRDHLKQKAVRAKAETEEAQAAVKGEKRIAPEELDKFLDSEDEKDEELSKKYPRAVRIDHMRCYGCGKCVPVCDRNALRMDDKKEQVFVLRTKCDGCGKCLDKCIARALIPGLEKPNA